MAKNFEAQSGGENRLIRFYKTWNKISAATLATAGVVLESLPLVALAGVDLLQNKVIKKGQEWWHKQKASAKNIGRTALGG